MSHALDGARAKVIVGKSSVLESLPVNGECVVVAITFPRTGVRRGTCAEKFLVHRSWWEIPVSLDADELVFGGFRDNDAVQDCFHTPNGRTERWQSAECDRMPE